MPAALVLMLALTLVLALATPAHAAFGVRWSLPGYARLGTGLFTQLNHVELLTQDAAGVAHLVDPNGGTIVAGLPPTFRTTGWQHLATNVTGDDHCEILAWTNTAGGGAQLELYGWNGSSIVRLWSVARPAAIDRVQLAVLGVSPVPYIALVTTSGGSRGLDVLDAASGALRYSVAPEPAASATVRVDEWESVDGTELLFATLDASGAGTYRMLGASGGTVALRWSRAGRLIADGPLAPDQRIDLVMGDPNGQAKLVDSETGADMSSLPGNFIADGSVVTRTFPVDDSGLLSLLQGGTLFGWRVSAIVQAWQINIGQYGALDDVTLTALESAPNSLELAFRCASALVLVDAVNGQPRFRSDLLGEGHATQLIQDDLIPTSPGNELLAFFPHAQGGTTMMLGSPAPGSVTVRYSHPSGGVLGLGTYRSFDHLDLMELDETHTSARLLDAATGVGLANLPASFSVDPGAWQNVFDLDQDGVPELDQLASLTTGQGGVNSYHWNGTAFVPRWNSTQDYAPNAVLTTTWFSDAPELQLGLAGEGRIVVLTDAGGGTIYDSATDGFTTVSAPDVNVWEDGTPQTDVLFDGSGPSRPAGLYLLSATTVTLGVDGPGGANPRVATLLPAAPNPFDGLLRTAFELPREGAAQLRVFDASGRLVRTLAQGRFAAGRHEARWDGRDDMGRRVPAGSYWCRFTSESGSMSRRVVRLP